jgi:tetratricopeptide (TPR) repeat protein
MEIDPSKTDAKMQGVDPNERLLLRITLLITALTYAQTLRFGFVLDDYSLIVDNPFAKSWRYLPQYFSSSFWNQGHPLAAGNFYRPLLSVWIRATYSVFRDRPLGWHLMTVLLYVMTTWLVYLVVRKLSGQFTVAWMAGLLFGLHPMHHEVVAWVTGMTETLMTLTFLAAFLAYLKSRESSKLVWMTVSCASYAMSLFCKETAFVLPALVFAHAWIEHGQAANEGLPDSAQRFVKALTPTAPYLPVALLYLLARYRVLSGLSHPLAPIPVGVWLMTVPSVLAAYLRHWFYPIGLAGAYDVFYQSRFNAGHVLFPLIILTVLGGAAWISRKRLGARNVDHAMAWLVIPLLPVLDFPVFQPDELVHDRYFYISGIGLAFLLALALERVARQRPRLFGQPAQFVTAGFALAVVLSFLAGRAASFWFDDFTFFSRAHQIAPANHASISNLGVALMTRQQFDKAQAILESGYRSDPTDFRFALNLGRLYYRKGQYSQAEFYTRQAISLAPDLGDAYLYLAQIQLRQGLALEAQKDLRRAVELNPYSAPFHTSYGIVLALSGDCAAATHQFEASLDLNPGDIVTQLQMARCRAAASLPAVSKPAQLGAANAIR